MAQRVLILTPVKDAARHLDRYAAGLDRLTYSRAALSLGLLESDSRDSTFELLSSRLPRLRERFRRVTLLQHDFDFHMPPDVPRWAPSHQLQRRTVLARSRNRLLSGALADEDWVLWLDVDVIDYPPDVIERLLATGKQLVTPHCVITPGGRTFDLNAWSHGGRLHLDDMRGGPDLVPLDAVGGTMLLVLADAHRDGLNFPAFPFGRPNPLVRAELGDGEVETEGLGLMAREMGYTCWGMPSLEIVHAAE
jgi:peptide chain release factor subunit 1